MISDVHRVYNFCTRELLRQQGSTRLRRRAALADRRRRRHAALRLQRGDDRRALPRRSTRRSPAIRTRSTTRSRPTRRWRSCGCCASLGSERRRQLRRRDRRRAARRVHSRRRSSSPASARRRPSSTQAIDLGVQDDQRRVGGRARAHRRDRARAADPRPASRMRVNPDIDARSHPHISTGLKTNKFGVAIDDARELCRRMRDRAGPRDRRPARPRRLADHRPGAAARAAGASSTLARELRGGRHRDRASRSRRRPRRLLRRRAGADRRATTPTALLPAVRDSGLAIVLEPGRSIVGPAGALADARRRRQGAAGRQAVRRPRRRDDRADPADALQRLPPHRAGRATRDGARSACDIVGPLCESSDTLGKDRQLRRARRSATCSPCSTPAPTAR